WIAALRHGCRKGLDHMAVGHHDPVADQKSGPDVLAAGIDAANRAEHRLNLWLRQGEGTAPRPEFRMIDVDRPVLDADRGSIGETDQRLEHGSLRTSHTRRALADDPMQRFLTLLQELTPHAAGEGIRLALSLLYGPQAALGLIKDVTDPSFAQVSPGRFQRKQARRFEAFGARPAEHLDQARTRRTVAGSWLRVHAP